MNKCSQWSNEWRRRFWNRPLDAVPYFIGSVDMAGLGAGVESGILLTDDVPDSVNGLRIDKVYTATQNLSGGGFLVRIYIAEVRSAGPATDVPTTIENLFVCGDPCAFDVAWVILPATHWQATVKNTSATAYTHGGLCFGGWYF